MVNHKFQLFCSCIICKTETSVQNISRHYDKHLEAPKEPKNKCLQCETLTYTKFCSHSCSATYYNARKDYTKIKTGPKKGSKPKNYIPWTRVRPCIVCGKFHTGSGKSCSRTCMSVLLSNSAISRIKNGWNPNEHRVRSKPSYLEKSFETWLNENNFTNYIKNKTIKCLSKWYFADFYFPAHNIIIELDGKQHKDTIEYDLQRDNMILKHHNLYTVRISYEEYFRKVKIGQIKTILGIP